MFFCLIISPLFLGLQLYGYCSVWYCPKVIGALLFFFQSFYFPLASFWRVSIIMPSSSLTLFFCCLQSAIKPNQWNFFRKNFCCCFHLVLLYSFHLSAGDSLIISLQSFKLLNTCNSCFKVHIFLLLISIAGLSQGQFPGLGPHFPGSLRN